MRRRIALALLMSGVLTGSMRGQTATGTMPVSALVIKTCLVAATPMLFGSYTSSNGTPTTTTATITVTCTYGTTYQVGLDAGTSSGATTSNRSMTYLTHLLGYGIYLDSAHTNNWGNNQGVDTSAGTGNGLVQSITAYGQMAAGQYVVPGAYADTITVSTYY